MSRAENIIAKVLNELGNQSPTKKQTALAEKLLFTKPVLHQLMFDNQLTEREITCLLFLAKGLRTGEIAHVLNLSKSTVETHRKNILRKLSCSTTSQAVFEGMSLGYIKPYAKEDK